LGNYNGSQRTQINKQTAVGTTNITFRIPETLEIIRKHGRDTRECVIKAAYDNGLLTVYNIRKKLPVRNEFS
jgi:hypothetical protein